MRSVLICFVVLLATSACEARQRQPVRRALRGVGHVVSAPFRGHCGPNGCQR